MLWFFFSQYGAIRNRFGFRHVFWWREPKVKSTVSVVAQKGFVKQDNGYLCLACEGSFKNAFLFQQHWKVLHESTIELYQCPEESACRYKPEITDIIQHLVDVHTIAKDKRRRQENPHQENYAPKCEVYKSEGYAQPTHQAKAAENSPKVAAKKSRVEKESN